MLICFRSNLLPAVPFAHNADPTDFSYYGPQYMMLHMEFFNKIKLERVVYRFKSFAIYDELPVLFCKISNTDFNF